MLRRTRRLTVPAVALLAAAAAAAPASAAERARTYQIDGVRTVVDRAAVAASGAAIVEVDHGYVVVTATRREVRFLTTRGYRAHRLLPPPRRGSRRFKDFPGADSAYHNYNEMAAETQTIANRRSCSASASAPPSTAGRCGP
jgi:carboxypeptidase T